jgi:hypothetical protein
LQFVGVVISRLPVFRLPRRRERRVFGIYREFCDKQTEWNSEYAGKNPGNCDKIKISIDIFSEGFEVTGPDRKATISDLTSRRRGGWMINYPWWPQEVSLTLPQSEKIFKSASARPWHWNWPQSINDIHSWSVPFIVSGFGPALTDSRGESVESGLNKMVALQHDARRIRVRLDSQFSTVPCEVVDPR